MLLRVRVRTRSSSLPSACLVVVVAALVALVTTSSALAIEADTYEVQRGDSLSEIALRAGVDLTTLVSLNGLEQPDLITVGTVLRLREPAPPAPPPRSVYVVADGDTLSEIALRFDVSSAVIVDLNGIGNPDRLAVGAELTVPVAPTPTPTPVPSPTPTPIPTATPTPTPPAVTATAQARTSATPLPTSPPRGTPFVGPTVVATPSASNAPANVQTALKLLGAKYVSGGVTPDGFDCSGFVFYVQAQVGKPVSRDIFDQYAAGPHPTDPLRPGDLVFFQDTYMLGLSHNGIYVGNGIFVHAIDETRGVGLSNLTDEYWMKRWYGATRIS